MKDIIRKLEEELAWAERELTRLEAAGVDTPMTKRNWEARIEMLKAELNQWKERENNV